MPPLGADAICAGALDLDRLELKPGMNPLAVVGRVAMTLCASVGELFMFAGRSIMGGLRGPLYPRQILRQMLDIGYYSLPVVGLTAIFTGMVLALQSYTGFSRFEASSAIPTIVVLSMTRELGPVLAGLMVAGPRGCFDGGRDRHHARHRADRRAHHALDRPVALSGRSPACSPAC